MTRIETKLDLLKEPSTGTGAHSPLGTESDDLRLTEIQQRTLRRTQLPARKPRPNWNGWKSRTRPTRHRRGRFIARKDDPHDAAAAKPKPVDPKLIKAWLSEAIEAPRAVLEMERVVKSLKQKDPRAASRRTRRKILGRN